MSVFLYVLREHGDDEVRYVGITDDPPRRLHHHRNIGSHLPSSKWARSHDVVMDVLAAFDSREEACVAEIDEIARRRAAGERLLNLHAGGTGGQMTAETKAKIAAALRARVVKPETRAKLASPEVTAARGSRKGQVYTEAQREAMRAWHREHPEHSREVGRANLGRKRPDNAERNRTPEMRAAAARGAAVREERRRG